MPELPEVETIRRYLNEALPGQQIDQVVHLDGRMVKRSPLDAETIRGRLQGRVFGPVERRGKFLLLTVGEGEALVIHLGMSGRLVVESEGEMLRPHTHLIVAFGDRHLRLSDPRRFGRIAWADASNAGLLLGIEPLSPGFGRAALAGVLRGRKVAVKTALLNQGLIAGLGNIYADEALFEARIHPERSAGSLSDSELTRLARAIRTVLERSIAHRGTSFSDYVDALGHPGDNQAYLHVYGREGKPCPRCHTPVRRLVLGGRSSHFCPRCQRLARVARITSNNKESR
ncbi:MAG: bifunctional DNA-formamidopyrimidine glycosylase/DNA-(apurinic or apyrimidinic site) lyase [Firmicutes bacterium]|nr:bifunctional DNA-formamidopyrimidine glycosylase/DNA-(apurinic or apyrimidinic site) lyase [Bacillota bacterium]